MVGEGCACRLCFDSIHLLTFVLEDASGWMGSIKTKSTAPPPPIFFPQAMLGSLCHKFFHLGACLQARKKGKQIYP